MKRTEYIMQTAAFAMVSRVFPQTHGLLFHVPNGGSRNIREAANLKKMGVVAGIPDMILLWKGTIYAFEFKAEDGAITDNQKRIHAKWAEHHVPVRIIRNQADFVLAIRNIVWHQ